MSALIPAHGGNLVNRIVTGPDAAALAQRAAALPVLRLSDRSVSDLEMIAIGGFSPLTGFMGAADYRAVVRDMHLAAGLPWTIPVTLAVDRAAARALREGHDVALADAAGLPLAVLTVTEVFAYDPAEEARRVYRTEDTAHPGVAALMRQGELLVAGPVTVFRRPPHADFRAYRLDPAETRAEFERRGWRRVVGFQTRNPVHRAHEYIQKAALEIVDGLLLHPLVGETKSDDIPAAVRMRCYEVLLEGYYPRERVVLAVNPAAMRYAGPREAIFHALVRKNYGCSHFIVGRDHAGVGNYYGPYDAQRIFDEFDPAALGITPLFFDHTFYCRRCEGMASTKTCPHPPEHHVALSGTKVRELLAGGVAPPPEFSRPEVTAVLIASLRGGAVPA
jgi:sulfate adenylyltransferase